MMVTDRASIDRWPELELGITLARSATPTPHGADTPNRDHNRLFGARLRAARLDRGLTAQRLADAAAVTKGFIGQVERGEASPSVSTLLRICDAIGISIGSLFESARSDLVRVEDRSRIEFGGSHVIDWLLSPTPESSLQVILSEIGPGGTGGGELYSLAADQGFVYVISGSVRVEIDATAHELRAGDALTFSPRAPHSWSNGSNTEAAEALWVLSPSPYGGRQRL